MLAQWPKIGVLHDRAVTGLVKRQLPARLAVFDGRFVRDRFYIVRQPGQLGFIFNEKREGVGRIKHVVVECRCQRREFFLHRFETRFPVSVQLGASKDKITQFVINRLILRGIQGKKA